MGNFIHRTTKQYVTSQNDPDYSVIDWIHNPDLSALTGVDQKYWKIVGDAVVEMTVPEKQAVDDAEAKASEDSEIDAMNTGILRRFILILIDEINNLRSEHGLTPRTLTQLKTAMRNK